MFIKRTGWARATPGRNMASTRGADIVKARVNAVVVVVVVGWRKSEVELLLQVVANALLKIEPFHLEPTRAEPTATSQLHIHTHTPKQLSPLDYSPPLRSFRTSSLHPTHRSHV
jgi:hypothetical protein